MGLDLSPLRGADRILVLLSGQKTDQHYQEFATGRTSDQWK